jgi:uncharacterized membrane protein
MKPSSRNVNVKKLLILLLVVVNVLCISVFFYINNKTPSKPSLEKLAQDVVNRCASAPYKPSCYDDEVPKLMKNISMEDAFKVTSSIQDIDTSFRYCHVLGHQLSAAEVDKDPAKWKEVLSRCPSGVCSNGCIHGAFQERFRKEHFTDTELQQYMPDLVSICEEGKTFHPTGLEQASCYHALGHLTMYITNGDIKKSLPLCDKISIKPDGRNFSQLCYDGAFMQIYQPLEPDDFALVKGKQPNLGSVQAFCDSFSGTPRDSCISESWPLYREKLMQNGKEISSICDRSSPQNLTRCYTGMFYVVTAQFNFDQNKIISYCATLSDPTRGKCFANAASRLIETDYRNITASVNLCKESEKYSTADADACFQELTFYAHYNFHDGSSQQKTLCDAMPSPWSAACRRSSTTSSQSRPFIHENN